MEFSLIDIFNKFINQANDELKRIFNKYCLGAGLSNEITYEDYKILLNKSLETRTDQGRRRVTYNRINSDTYVHKQLSFYSFENAYFNSLYIAKEPLPGKYPYITMTNYEYYTGIVFLIHNDIKYNSIKLLELVKLTSAWYEYSVHEILGIIYPKCIYRYANVHVIYHSDKKLTTAELKKLKIYTNRFPGKEEIIYD